MMNHLFAYGTLMCEEIMQNVAGCHLAQVPGLLTGYRRRSVKGEHYPALVPDKTGCVEGVIYLDVPPAAWDRLDRFEGEMYVRQPVPLGLNDGTILPADTYVINPAFLDRLGETDWDFGAFLRHGRESFQKHYQGYQAL